MYRSGAKLGPSLQPCVIYFRLGKLYLWLNLHSEWWTSIWGEGVIPTCIAASLRGRTCSLLEPSQIPIQRVSWFLLSIERHIGLGQCYQAIRILRHKRRSEAFCGFCAHLRLTHERILRVFSYRLQREGSEHLSCRGASISYTIVHDLLVQCQQPPSIIFMDPAESLGI